MNNNRIYFMIGIMNFPERIKEGEKEGAKRTILARRTITIEGQQYIIGPWVGPTDQPNQDERFQIFEPVAFTTVFFKPTLQEAQQALKDIEPDIEWLLDHLSFQMLHSIKLVRLEIIDITPPIAIGEERDFIFYPFPVGYPLLAKHRSTMSIGNQVTLPQPVLIPREFCTDTKTRTALRFFNKGQEAKADLDAFTFFWASLEIIAMDRQVEMVPLTIGGCGHKIDKCPECGIKVPERSANWKTIKKYLTSEIGLSESLSETLWKLRHAVHGGNHLDLESTQQLPELLVQLKAAVIHALKSKFNIPLDSAPLIKTDDFLILHKRFGLFGHRAIKEVDLARICYYWENCFLPK